MKISVIGAGYVGLTTAACLAEVGHDVICADNDEGKLNVLRAGNVPFFEPNLDHLVMRNSQSGRLRFSATEVAVDDVEVIFICVGTPPLDNGEADLSAIANVARTIGQRARGRRVVIEKSTVPVQTGQQLKRQLQLYASRGLQCELVSNPEFLREGSAIEDFFHPDRIVIGVGIGRGGERGSSQLSLRDLPAGAGTDVSVSGSFKMRTPEEARVGRDRYKFGGTNQARVEFLLGNEDFLHQHGGRLM